MIRRGRNAGFIAKEFVVTDIENRENGDVITIDTYDGNTHHISYDWGDWLAYVESKARTNRNYRTVYAHNGFGWDWLSFVDWVLKRDPDTEFVTAENGAKVVSMRIKLPRVTIVLADSLLLLKCKLDKAAKIFLNESKVELQHLPEWYWEHDRETYWRYQYADTELLYRIMVEFCNLVYQKIAPIGKLGITLPSTALKCFTTGYLAKDIGTPQGDELCKALRVAYMGGRVEAFKPGVYENVYVYDFNSLYPSVMATTPVPDTGNATRTRKLELGRCGVYHVRFLQRDRTRPAILMRNGSGVFEGSGWYYTNELRRLADLPGTQLDVEDGYVFESQSVVFDKYVNTLYSMRIQNKESPLGEICKVLMNSLYGKFGQRQERTKTVRCSIDQLDTYLRNNVQCEVVSEEHGLYRITEQKKIPYEHVGIAGTITSEARALLWEQMDSDTIYCDTDSIHTTKMMPCDPSKLGALKLEFSGEGAYAGRKLYALRNAGTEKVRAKGVKVGGNFGFKLDFETMRSVVQGRIVETEFKTPSTFKSVLKGNQSCRFNPRKRKIRRTA